MSEATTMRRLAAILAADVVGYSRMMGEDEAGTLAALRKIWSELFNPAVASHRGRIVKMMGDGALVEFGSAVDAVQCAIADPEGDGRAATARRPATSRSPSASASTSATSSSTATTSLAMASTSRRGWKARRRPAACSSPTPSTRRCSGKVDLVFADAGEIALKNIEQPVRVWRWGEGACALPSSASRTRRRAPKSRRSPCSRSPT